MEDPSAILMLEKIIKMAMEAGASDIHIEPMEINPEENSFRLRFRREGYLYTAMNLDFLMGERIISRLKVLSNLNIAERRLPQDGRFSIQLLGCSSLDIRLSTCPTRLGEKLVLRLQSEQERNFLLSDLGLDKNNLEQLYLALSKSQGMIIVTGPTGSGKTLSLYAALQQLNQISKNICTVEDPIEMKLAGITQVQIQPKIGLSFAAVFSAFLRQDPDILMLGEIRDFDSAEIAMKAAHTGHLVLTTLHTNSALETLTRLSGMGILNYSIATAVSVLIAQRLLRKLCNTCKQIDPLGPEILNIPEIKIFKPQGCEKCHEGFLGRMGCFELIPMTEGLRGLILSGANILEMQAYCKDQGYWSLSRAALEKVIQGETSLSEIASVI